MTSAKTMWGRRPIHGSTRGDIEDYKAWRRTVHRVREVTIRHDLHALSLLFQYAVKHNWCRGNPIREVEIPSDAEAQRCNVLSPADEMNFFEAIDALVAEKTRTKRTKELRSLQDIRDLSTLMLNQGCRPEELRELRPEHVDLERGLLTIQRGKSAAARRVLPMTAVSRDVLARRLQGAGMWVFQGRGGNHIGQSQRLWGTVIKKAPLSMVMYDLRHTFATRAIERGVELPKLMAILGHANLRSIMRYVHISQEHITEGMRRFEVASDSCPPFARREPGKSEISRVVSISKERVQ